MEPGNKKIPHGYKMTSLGIIPQEWEVKQLGEICTHARLGGNYENAESNTGIPVIKMGNIGRGKISIERIQYLPVNESYDTMDVLQNGDLLFNTRNTLELVGKVAMWRNELPFAIYNSNLMRIHFDINYVQSNDYMNYNFNSHNSIKQLRGYATGTTSVAAIYGRDLFKLKIHVPPLCEQEKIVKILSLWDEAIDKQSRLIEKLELRKRALLQQLLVAKIRLKGFVGKWNETHIKDFSKEVSIRNKSNKDMIVLSCTKYDGLVPSLEYFGRKIFADDTSGYKVVHKHHFAYATNHIEEGSIGYQKDYDEALVSPMYTVFKTNTSVNDDLLYTLLKSHRLIYQYNARMEGSIDRRGGLRWDSFSTIKIKLPALAEQTAIAEILTNADQEIYLARKKLESLRQQKKGLMQQLLTGKTRVKI